MTINKNSRTWSNRIKKHYLHRMLHVLQRPWDEVNDLFQEVLIRLWQGFAN